MNRIILTVIAAKNKISCLPWVDIGIIVVPWCRKRAIVQQQHTQLMADSLDIKERESVVVRFSGDSGDGMQLAGNIFSTVSATVGNSISTFPDYPADIRAPQGSLTGVSGFQVHIGAGQVFTPGDQCDVLVAMNASDLRT